MPIYCTIHIQSPYWDQDVIPFADQVYESEQVPVDTGLVNAEGLRIFRKPEPKLPIGFQLSKGTS